MMTSRELVAAAIADAGVSGPQQMGAVMKVVQPQVAGRADGGRIAAEVKRQLRRSRRFQAGRADVAGDRSGQFLVAWATTVAVAVAVSVSVPVPVRACRACRACRCLRHRFRLAKVNWCRCSTEPEKVQGARRC